MCYLSSQSPRVRNRYVRFLLPFLDVVAVSHASSHIIMITNIISIIMCAQTNVGRHGSLSHTIIRDAGRVCFLCLDYALQTGHSGVYKCLSCVSFQSTLLVVTKFVNLLLLKNCTKNFVFLRLMSQMNLCFHLFYLKCCKHNRCNQYPLQDER